MVSRRKRIFTAYLFLLPALLLLGVFTFYPIICSLILSFCRYNIVTAPVFVGLKNFKSLLADPRFWIAMRNSITYLLIVPVIQFFSILIAIAVNREIRGINLFRAACYIPVITSIVVVALAWRWILQDRGILNYFLSLLHITSQPIPWLTQPSTALLSVMFVTLWKGLGYYMVIYLAGLQNISSEYVEAARIDGASKTRIFFSITLPLLKPSIALCSIISSIAALKVFAEIYVMTEGGPLFSTTTMVYYIYQRAFTLLDIGYASAMALILAVVIGIFSYFNLKLFHKGGLQYY